MLTLTMLALALPSLSLWYDKPAANWNEALPVGNGRLGAMVFGGTAEERLQLNDDTLWAGRIQERHNPKALEALPQVRRLIFDGKNEEAARLAGQTMMGVPPTVESYQTLGDLHLSQKLKGERLAIVGDNNVGLAKPSPFTTKASSPSQYSGISRRFDARRDFRLKEWSLSVRAERRGKPSISILKAADNQRALGSESNLTATANYFALFSDHRSYSRDGEQRSLAGPLRSDLLLVPRQ